MWSEKKSKRKKWIQFMNPMVDFRLDSQIVYNFRVMGNFYDHVILHQKLTIPCNPNESSYIQFESSQWVESLEPYGLDNTLTWISKIFNLGKLFFLFVDAFYLQSLYTEWISAIFCYCKVKFEYLACNLAACFIFEQTSKLVGCIENA